MCDCIQQMNAKLDKHNTRVDSSVSLFNPNKPEVVVLSASKVDKKIRIGPASVVANFCPFCGEKYIDKDQPASITIESKRVESTIREQLTDWFENYLAENIGEDVLSCYDDQQALRKASEIYNTESFYWAKELAEGGYVGNNGKPLIDEIGWAIPSQLDQFDYVYDFKKLLDAGLVEKHPDAWKYRITQLGRDTVTALDKKVDQDHMVKEAMKVAEEEPPVIPQFLLGMTSEQRQQFVTGYNNPAVITQADQHLLLRFERGEATPDEEAVLIKKNLIHAVDIADNSLTSLGRSLLAKIKTETPEALADALPHTPSEETSPKNHKYDPAVARRNFLIMKKVQEEAVIEYVEKQSTEWEQLPLYAAWQDAVLDLPIDSPQFVSFPKWLSQQAMQAKKQLRDVENERDIRGNILERLVGIRTELIDDKSNSWIDSIEQIRALINEGRQGVKREKDQAATIERLKSINNSDREFWHEILNQIWAIVGPRDEVSAMAWQYPAQVVRYVELAVMEAKASNENYKKLIEHLKSYRIPFGPSPELQMVMCVTFAGDPKSNELWLENLHDLDHMLESIFTGGDSVGTFEDFWQEGEGVDIRFKYIPRKELDAMVEKELEWEGFY